MVLDGLQAKVGLQVKLPSWLVIWMPHGRGRGRCGTLRMNTCMWFMVEWVEAAGPVCGDGRCDNCWCSTDDVGLLLSNTPLAAPSVGNKPQRHPL